MPAVATGQGFCPIGQGYRNATHVSGLRPLHRSRMYCFQSSCRGRKRLYLWHGEKKVPSGAGAGGYNVRCAEPGCMPRTTRGPWGLDDPSQVRRFRLSNLFPHCGASLRLCFC